MKKIFFIILSLLLATLPSWAAESNGRFFLEGDGQLTLVSKSGGKVNGSYRNKDGTYNRVYLDAINKLFGMPPSFGEDISLRTIAFVDYLQDIYAPGKPLQLLSGYRSPKLNAALHKTGHLAARTSYHLDGMAADLIFPGVDSKAMWKNARGLMYGGVGYYDGKSVHIDSGRPRFWLAASALPKKDEPPQNKNIYLSVDLDKYKIGETMRLFFSGISDYPFGVKETFVLKKDGHRVGEINPQFKIQKTVSNNCYPIETREQARFIYWKIPAENIPYNDKLTLEVTFCNPVTPLMPEKIDSRTFLITR